MTNMIRHCVHSALIKHRDHNLWFWFWGEPSDHPWILHKSPQARIINYTFPGHIGALGGWLRSCFCVVQMHFNFKNPHQLTHNCNTITSEKTDMYYSALHPWRSPIHNFLSSSSPIAIYPISHHPNCRPSILSSRSKYIAHIAPLNSLSWRFVVNM